MDDSEREALRERNRRRANCCPRCGGTTRRLPGTELAAESHFPAMLYKVCPSCGWECVILKRSRRRKLD